MLTIYKNAVIDQMLVIGYSGSQDKQNSIHLPSSLEDLQDKPFLQTI